MSTKVAVPYRRMNTNANAQCKAIYLDLTHWGRDKMAAIFQTTFSNAFSWMKMHEFRKISLKFVPKVPINNIPALVLIMAWRRLGDKPLSEPMMVSLPTHICVTRPQWVNLKTASYHFDWYVSQVVQEEEIKEPFWWLIDTLQDFPLNLILYSNLTKIHLPINHFSFAQSFRKSSESKTVILLCSSQNLKRIKQIK